MVLEGKLLKTSVNINGSVIPIITSESVGEAIEVFSSLSGASGSRMP